LFFRFGKGESNQQPFCVLHFFCLDRSTGIWVPNRAAIFDERPDQQLVCEPKRLLALAPRGAGQRLQNLQSARGPCHNIIDVVRKGELCVPSNTQDLGAFVEGNDISLVEDLWVKLPLCRVRCEQGYTLLVRGN
jgi:hypothetical protein